MKTDSQHQKVCCCCLLSVATSTEVLSFDTQIDLIY